MRAPTRCSAFFNAPVTGRSLSFSAALVAVSVTVVAGPSPAAGADNCAVGVQPLCLKSLGAGVEAQPADCDAQLDRYRACLSDLIAQTPPADLGSESESCGEAQTRLLWAEVEEDANCLSYAAFLEACPASSLAPLARARRAKLACNASSSAFRTLRDARSATKTTASGACVELGGTLSRAIAVRRGSKLCSADDPSQSATVTTVQRRGLAYRNGRFGTITCKIDEVCGVHWSATLRFRVRISDQEPGLAYLEPARF